MLTQILQVALHQTPLRLIEGAVELYQFLERAILALFFKEESTSRLVNGR
jgi:hypothetical protein